MSQIDLARSSVEEAGYVRFVVIKRMKVDTEDNDRFVRMFMDEARITAELHHANIAQVYDFGKVDESYFLALEYIAGLDLRGILRRLAELNEAMPVGIVLRVMVDMLDGLAYAHERIDRFGRRMNIVHRDVNPRNIMVSARGEVKLIDFGVAKAAGRLEKTTTNVVKGKVGYMAPEQIEGLGVDQRADVFAAGLTLYELLAGSSPFYGLGEIQVMNRLLNKSLPDPPMPGSFAGSHDLLAAYRRAVERDADARYQDARALRDDLLAVADAHDLLASRQELAAFLRRIDPDLHERISGTVSRYSVGNGVFEGTLAGPVEGPPPTEEFDPGDPSGRDSGTLSLSRPQMVVGGVAVATLGMVGGGVAAVVLVVLVVVLLWTGGPAELSAPAAPTADEVTEDTARVVDGLQLLPGEATHEGQATPGQPGRAPASAESAATAAPARPVSQKPGSEPPAAETPPKTDVPEDEDWAEPESDLKSWE